MFAEYEFLKNIFKRSSNSDIFFTNPPDWYIPNSSLQILKESTKTHISNFNGYSVLVLRDEGSNGDEEMCAFFKCAGYEVINFNMNMSS